MWSRLGVAKSTGLDDDGVLDECHRGEDNSKQDVEQIPTKAEERVRRSGV